jgi:hypothetical protein
MEYTDRQKAELRGRFSATKRRRVVALIALTTAAVLALIPIGDPQEAAGTWEYALLTVAVVSVAYSFFIWRCPGCNSRLRGHINVKACERCGLELT